MGLRYVGAILEYKTNVICADRLVLLTLQHLSTVVECTKLARTLGVICFPNMIECKDNVQVN